MLLNDIAKTICQKIDIQSECEKFNGINLLGKSLKSNEPYYIYTAKNNKSSIRYNTHQSVKIPTRNIPLLQAMKRI